MELGVWETPVQTHAPDALHVPALFLPGATADTLSADARLGDVIMECPAVGLGGGLWGQLVSHARMPSPPSPHRQTRSRVTFSSEEEVLQCSFCGRLCTGRH